MDNGINEFIKEIKLNTGIAISVYSNNGEFLAGENSQCDIPFAQVNGIYQSEENNETYFRINKNGESYIAVIKGHQENERAFAFLISNLASKNTMVRRDANGFIQSLLLGEIDANQVPLLAKQFGISNKALAVLVMKVDEARKQEVIDFLKNYNLSGKDVVSTFQQDVCVLIKYLDSVVKEYFSLSEYAETLTRSIYEETGIQIKIGIGGRASNLVGASTSFSQAMSSLELMKKIKSAKSVHTYKEFVLEKVIEEMPKNRQIDYLKLLMEEGTKEFFNDEEMLTTALAFLDNDLNASETSRILYIHRNTLNYRLDKIQNLTGFNLRKFSEATTFKIITYLYKLLG